MTGAAHEWSVNHLAITAGSRLTIAGESEPCLRAVVVQHELSSHRVWELQDILAFTFTFTFTSALVAEVGP